MSTCSSCRNLDIQSLSRTTWLWKSLPSKSVLAAAQAGCSFCGLLVVIVGHNAREVMRRASASWVRIYFEPEDKVKAENGLGIRWLHTTVSESIKPRFYRQPGGYSTLHVAADEGTPAAISGDVRGRYVDEVSPFDSIKLIKDWWSTCETHTTCSRTLSGRPIDPDQTPLPKRCIRVTTTSSTDNADLTITLEETEGKHGRYICLSHRWVQPDTGMSATTASNYPARISGANFGNLPHRFLQAFRTAAEFAIKYVWIDSLCIIQDAPGDWETESAMMGGYYQLASFTFISTLSTSDFHTQYSPAKPKFIARLPYRDDTGVKKGSFYIYPRRDASELSKEFTEHIGNSQILERGWVFQEWLLSRRIICFTQSGVYTQCLCRDDTVRNQLGEDLGLSLYRDLEAVAILSIKSSLRLELDTAEAIYCGWECVVEQYSGLEFSYPEKDRIMALLGVANEFAATLMQTPCHKEIQTTEDLFITGIWTRDLERGLLWEQVVPGTHKRLANFPTWSWASILSAVRWRGRHRAYIEPDILSAVKTQQWSRSHGRSKHKLTFVACTAIASHRIPVLHSQVEPPNGSPLPKSSPDSEGRVIEPEYDVLHLRGRLQAVHIGDKLSKRISNSTTADGNVCNQENPSFHGQRLVATTGLRDVISGWASLEHPEFQDDAVFTKSPLIFALLVSSIPNARKVNRLSESGCPVAEGSVGFNVLYLQRSTRIVDGFERLGMGRLFGHNAGKEFDMAKERDIRLV